ncbi:hypothetical protein GCM10027076_22890 [Nocardioides montaniterrae]
MLLAALALLVPATPADASNSVTFRPRPIPLSSAEIANTGRGQVRWQGQATQPAGWPSRDVYYRDQVYWGRLERTPGAYDFSPLDAGLADAASTGGRPSFRVMAWCPGCWMESHPTTDGKPPATPTWLPKQPLAMASPPPAWNSPGFLSAWRRLMTALGRRYDSDPRLGTVDVGGYGAFGEWHTDGIGSKITVANARQVVSAVLDAFPHHQVLINTMVPAYVVPALRMSPRVGVRQDCLGSTGFPWTFDAYPIIRDRWRTAPVVTEWCHDAGQTTSQRGLAQVPKYHVSVVSSGNAPWTYQQMTSAQRDSWRAASERAGFRYRIASVTTAPRWRSGVATPVTVRLANTGSAPTYDAWRLRLRLLRPDGSIAASRAFPGDLRRLLPGTSTRTAQVRFEVPAGRYRIALAVTSTLPGIAPMALATRGRTADGSYPVGSISIG